MKSMKPIGRLSDFMLVVRVSNARSCMYGYITPVEMDESNPLVEKVVRSTRVLVLHLFDLVSQVPDELQ